MTFVSYAQNFEDVLLWRALGHIPDGFYIDVGAAHPDVDSVTRAFYDRGWRGINIEPVAADFRRLVASRPRDINLDMALAARAGTETLFVIEGTGLSTLQEHGANDIAAHGRAIARTEVRVDTLAKVCEQHALDTIHFLKIDVEGFEESVLAGADFVRFRPWIILIEATEPMSRRVNYTTWEPILTAADYRFVWFDGLNRFYVATEQWTQLSPHFTTPPNVFDDFLRAADTEWARRISQAESGLAEMGRRAIVAEARAGALEQTLADERIARLRMQIVADLKFRDSEQRLGDWRKLEQRAEDAESWVGSMRSSTSWRVTGPLRRGVRLARTLRGNSPDAATEPPDFAPDSSNRPATVRSRQGAVRAKHVVHQFHSGCAVGDAITNAMLLTRRLLREAGYVSEIFVEHGEPALANEVRPIDELPKHDGYILILRHSMGYDAFDRVLALPATKILIYHNITPPEFLEGFPFLQHYARLGRSQLDRLVGNVSAALGDSEFNVTELARLGFEATASCTLLFNPDGLREAAKRNRSPARAAPDRDGDAVFTLLFVGRVTPSKAQLDLVTVFDMLRRMTDRPCRLVLVGRHDGIGDPYYDTISAYLQAHDLTDIVTLTGLVSDEALHAWYGQADLYVSLSHHEGFGVPLVEAMAHDVPVLAWPCGAVPYTLGDQLGILTDREPAAVASRIVQLAQDAALRRELVARQQKAFDRFDLARHVMVLSRSLIRAGAAPPRDPTLRDALAANLRFTVSGHLNGSYSLAAINRTLALMLESVRPGAVRAVAVEGNVTEDLSGVPPECRQAVQVLTSRRSHVTGPEVVISQHYPVHVPDHRGDVTLALFFWEESVVPSETVALLNHSFDGILTASRFSAKALRDSGVHRRIAVIGHAPDLEAFRQLPRHPGRAAEKPFTFLHVSSAFPRKGIDVLLAAYVRSFRIHDQVQLVIKSFPNPHNDVAAQIAAIQSADPSAPSIVAISHDCDTAELLSLYENADAVVLPTRGEGFNLPAAEAMAARVPVIVTGFGGHMDFCDQATVRLVSYRFAASRSHLATAGSVWVEPDVDDLSTALREAVTASSGVTTRTTHAAEMLEMRLSPTRVVDRLAEAAVDMLLELPSPPIRIAWISTWDVRCGIAEYSRHLLEALPEASAAEMITVLGDERCEDGASGRLQVRSSWRRVDASSIPTLAAGITEANPDVVVLQHQPGLLGWAMLAAFLELPLLRSLVVAVTLHNTRHLLDCAEAERSWAATALAQVTRVIVHTVADLNLLKQLGLEANVVMIPQGVPARRPPAVVKALTQTRPVLIGCYGFFVPNKGIPQLIAALGLLRARWPKARLRLVNAEYDATESAAEIATCRAAASAAGLADAIEWVTDFLAAERSVDLLAACDLIVLPYQSSKEASSAALRTALSAGVCVAVTPLPLFDEADDAVIRFAGIDPPALADGIDAVLGDRARRESAQLNGAKWCRHRSWQAIAERTLGMLQGLQEDQRLAPNAAR